jgi:dsDNA-specific endonuclease/ATPase MutS2
LLKQITNEAISNSIKQKDTAPKPKVQKELKLDTEEIDLHIEELVDNHQNLSNGEIIQLQIARFETALEGGIRSNSTKKMIFIHGLGNGKLKFEVKKILDTKYSKLKYQDASFKEYGYGATLVYIR